MTLTSAAFTAVVVGFASTILVVMEAAKSLGASAPEQASWAAILCIGMAVTSLILSVMYRMPIITAWSTPGAALIVTSHTGIAYAEALGAFAVAGGLMVATALIKPLARAISHIPTPIASAMLAGVLLKYCMGVPQAAIDRPFAVLPLILLFFILRLKLPLYAVPLTVAAGLALSPFSGGLASACCEASLTPLVWVSPDFNLASAINLAVPLYIVTMASQNLPGFAVLRSAGYRPPVSACLLVTGAASVMIAPFGGHAVNMAAITASIVTGPDTHADPKERWRVVLPYSLLYLGVGLTAGLFVQVLGALPGPMIKAIAGLALFSPLLAGLAGMVSSPRDIESSAVTFLVTASGLTVYGVGGAFWGLMAGLLLFGARHWFDPPSRVS